MRERGREGRIEGGRERGKGREGGRRREGLREGVGRRGRGREGRKDAPCSPYRSLRVVYSRPVVYLTPGFFIFSVRYPLPLPLTQPKSAHIYFCGFLWFIAVQLSPLVTVYLLSLCMYGVYLSNIFRF